MNRIAILVLVLLVAALAILLYHRAPTAPDPGMEQIDQLFGLAREGAAAAEQARSLLETVIENSASDPVAALQARLRLVELERLLGDDQAAAEALRAALWSHPDTPQAPRLLMELGSLHHRQLERPTEALETYRRLLALYPESDEAPEALVRSALLARSLKQDTATADADALLAFSRQRPDHPLADEALLLAASLTAGTGETDRERVLLDELHRRFPDSPLSGQPTDTSQQEIDDELHTETR